MAPARAHTSSRRQLHRVRRSAGSRCETFLAGGWAAGGHDDRRPLPRWAWLDLIAHADVDRIRETAELPAPERSPWSGDDIQGVLARAVLAAVSPDDLRRVQHDVLVPLELRVMASVMSPRRVVERVGDALYRA